MSPDERQAVLDEEHLRLLALFHYISGAMTLAFSLFFGAWMVFMGALFTLVSRAEAASANPGGSHDWRRRRPPARPALPRRTDARHITLLARADPCLAG